MSEEGGREGATTAARTIVHGAVAARGSAQSYRSLRYGSGEEHVVRDDLLKESRRDHSRSIAYLAHLTDIQLLDAQSPGRLEMIHDYAEDPASAPLLPAQRPQELLAAHAADALVRAINAHASSPISGARLQLTLTTGDMIDNMQWNEVQAFLSILSGGRVRMDSGGPDYEGVQDGRFPWAWAPEVADGEWGRSRAFPQVPGLIAAALREFSAQGLDVPWLACHGNHDGLIQGRARLSDELAGILTGNRKPYDVPPGPLGDFAVDPARLLSGPSWTVTPSGERRPVGRKGFVEAHFLDGGSPLGHGFTAENIAEGTAYYAYDGIPGVRIIVLDTTNPAGNFEGSIDEQQFAWLRQRLLEVHESYLDENGRTVPGGGEDRLVLVASHHPRASMTNNTAAPGVETEHRILGEQVSGLLDRFPNVLAWISGHIHRHQVLPRRRRGSGYWEITTASVMEWPSQIRLLEILENDDATLSLVSTILDHDAPVRPGDLETPRALASWHRELAANSPFSVGGLVARGERGDRNVELVMADPRRRR
jgi:metallophosphoesterase (TIGR03767 family)